MLDLVSGYWQVSLDQDAQEKAALTTRGGKMEMAGFAIWAKISSCYVRKADGAGLKRTPME